MAEKGELMNFIKSKTYLEDIQSIMDSAVRWEALRDASILITGAAGLIGSFIVDCLIVADSAMDLRIKLYVMGRSESKLKARFQVVPDKSTFQMLIGDVCAPLQIDADIDFIIHAASNAHPIAFSQYPADTMKANLIGTLNLLEYAIAHNCKRFMYVSSGEIYGINDSSCEKPLMEDYGGYHDLSNPRSVYPESKRAGEVLCTAYQKQYGLNTVSVRPWYIYGATMKDESSKADAQFLRKAANKENIIMKSAGVQARSYCYVSDCIQAMLCVLLNGDNGAYNIAGSDTATIKDFAEICAAEARSRVVYEVPGTVEQSGYSLAPNGICSAERAERAGYKPKIQLHEGIRRTLTIIDECRKTNDPKSNC
ncbi:hypothetical protein FACS18948_2060 [Clostridia bacterium]|nr:hypothetical protein FACS18948_2060 [Clostridia bacterium]